jgi:hypothetical protein
MSLGNTGAAPRYELWDVCEADLEAAVEKCSLLPYIAPANAAH